MASAWTQKYVVYLFTEMVSTTSQVLAAGMGASFLYAALCHPKVMGSPEASVLLNTLSLSMFIVLIHSMAEYDGKGANEPNAFVHTISNRTVGAMLLVVFTIYTSVNNAYVVRQVKAPKL